MGEVQSGEESGLAIGEPAANVRQAFGLEGDRLMKCVVLRNVLGDASLGLSPIPSCLDSIYKYAKAGRLPCFRIGTSVRFCPKAVADWLRAQ